MSISVNIRHLEEHSVKLAGEASIEELDLQTRDELIRFRNPVRYDLEVQKIERDILVQGVIGVVVECDCVRCLRTFSTPIRLADWTVHLPLVGEESVPIENDSVDLTPWLREDILLALPQHPLCSKECEGLLRDYGRRAKSPMGKGLVGDQASPWDDLDKLDL